MTVKIRVRNNNYRNVIKFKTCVALPYRTQFSGGFQLKSPHSSGLQFLGGTGTRFPVGWFGVRSIGNMVPGTRYHTVERRVPAYLYILVVHASGYYFCKISYAIYCHERVVQILIYQYTGSECWLILTYLYCCILYFIISTNFKCKHNSHPSPITIQIMTWKAPRQEKALPCHKRSCLLESWSAFRFVLTT